ncbi:uncharacterized protein AB675_6610 [Cyphellophora attinorum]|uniref:DUF7918 domain-containing protein n=1 Tax=Cyphellophora attinorum TaxID=1664694 RepID=A0A0N1HEI8_9EURO|nr:uncharacterized protein AB675_6610 [Phialophora attinorum]KPI43847.1 hypothetical protein AB675_6610 [Phialophora attinorum]
MAINRKISVVVVVNHQAAREYWCPLNDPNASAHPHLSTVYIEGKPGAEFHFTIKLEKKFKWNAADVVVVDAYIDGKGAGGVLLHEKRSTAGWHLDRRPRRSVQGEARSGETAASIADEYGEVGVLQLNVCRGRLGQQIPASRLKTQRPTVSGLIPEEVLRDGHRDLTTGYKVVPTTAAAAPAVRQVTRFDKPMVSQFKFMYKTRRGLKNAGIIEDSPDPIPLADRDPDTLGREELLQLYKKSLAEKQAQEPPKVIKRELDAADDVHDTQRPRKAIKRELDATDSLRHTQGPRKAVKRELDTSGNDQSAQDDSGSDGFEIIAPPSPKRRKIFVID